MNQSKLSEDSLALVAVALRMVAESRPKMNTMSREAREALEQEARADISGVKTQSLCAL